MNDIRVHPWHRVKLTLADRRQLRALAQQLAHHYPGVPAGKIIRMVYGTAHLLTSAGSAHEQLAAQVEVACHAALQEDTTNTENLVTEDHRILHQS